MEYLAHISENKKRIQTVKEHEDNTGNIAGDYSSKFGFEEYGKELGNKHDTGKYADVFQRRIRGSGEKYEHSAAGLWLFKKESEINKSSCIDYTMMATIIGAHHTGLPDFGTKQDDEECKTFMGKYYRKCKQIEDNKGKLDFEAYKDESKDIPKLNRITEEWRNGSRGDKENISYRTHFVTRMLFSSLVDADFIDTEKFMNNRDIRVKNTDSVSELLKKFNGYMEGFKSSTGKINEYRQEILNKCIESSGNIDGIAKLTVPTGGGKTLSSMAYALNTAVKMNRDRIIYVIPYISIIKQTVAKFEEIFDKKNVLGHYSTAEYKKEVNEQVSKEMIATENWDSPIIVTTNVQFFESLYSNKVSKCRKLHNIANSVVIFDEAQMIETGYIKPCLRAISEISKNYNCNCVMCTATQPAIDKIVEKYKVSTHEICSNTSEMYEQFKRVEYRNLGKVSDEEVIDGLCSLDRGMCIVNRKKTAALYYDMVVSRIGHDGVYHLSKYMCQEHINDVIEEIRNRLSKSEKCIVVSTCLIEAGVDIDFPVVYRELASLSSIIQAGGRCNREGKLDSGHVFIFERDENSKSSNDVSTYITKDIIDKYEDISCVEAIEDYFNRLYKDDKAEIDKLDVKNIIGMITNQCFDFEKVSDAFELIETRQTNVIVPYKEDGEKVVNKIRQGIVNRDVLRESAKYSIGLYDNEMNELLKQGDVTLYGTVYVLNNIKMYDEKKGLVLAKLLGEAMII